MDTLKGQAAMPLVDAAVADEIFYKIPVVNLCHKAFYKHLTEKVDNWHEEETLGDVFLQSVSPGMLWRRSKRILSFFLAKYVIGWCEEG